MTSIKCGFMCAVAFTFMASVPLRPASAQLNCTGNCNPTIALVPTSASGNYIADGNEIVVAPGSYVYVEVQLAHWGGATGQLLLAYQVTMDSSSYANGGPGSLAPLAVPCTDFYTCVVQTKQGPCASNGGCCRAGSCTSGYIDQDRQADPIEFVFANVNWSSLVEPYFADGRFSVASINGAVADPGTVRYAATLLLQVPADAIGTFTVKIAQAPADSFLLDATGGHIEPIVFEPAKITVAPGGAVLTTENRFLEIRAGRQKEVEAIRVTLADLDGAFSVLNGTTLWVGEPKIVNARPGKAWNDPIDPGDPVMWVAELSCDYYFTYWQQFTEPIHVYHESIVPNSVYEIQQIFGIANPLADVSFSSPVAVRTARWGDVAGPFDAAAGGWTLSDGSVDVTSDVIAILDAFRSLSTAPVKTRLDLDSSVPDGKINISDVLMAIRAFAGLPFPFTPNAPVTCP